MTKVKRVIVFCAMIGLALSLGCQDTEEITQIDGFNKNENNFAVVNAQNSFSIAVTAKALNSAVEYQLDFNKLSFGIALSVDNLTLGDVTIQVFNDTKQMLYKADFKQKISLAQNVDLEEKPTKIKFIFNNFTASFSCALTAK
ncbi:hypothetical protein C0389_02225 [bacterium]|nr:hypothetical protein [bacterium]